MIPCDIMRFHNASFVCGLWSVGMGSRKTHQSLVKAFSRYSEKHASLFARWEYVRVNRGSTMQDIWDSCMAAWQVLGGPYWICRSRSGGFWGKTKVLRISRLWLVQTASGSTAIRRMYWTQFQFKMVQGIYPNLSKSVAFTITLRCCEPERLANTTSTQLDAAYFPSCTCLLHTTKLDQSQQVLSEATFMMKIQLGWPLRAIIGDPFCISSVPYYSFRLFPLRCHPSQQTLRPEPRDHWISMNVISMMKVQSTKNTTKRYKKRRVHEGSLLNNLSIVVRRCVRFARLDRL